MIYIRKTFPGGITQPSWFDVRPLVYDPMLSRFLPNTSIKVIVKSIMIEQWNPSYSYSRFYESCAPSYCIYYKKIRTKTIIRMMTTLLSMIGGLTVLLHLYNDLIQKYGNKLKCSCSLIASPRNRFVNIEAKFHEICSSPFVSNEWQINLTSGLVSNLSVYARRDYRRFLSAHLQFLTGLCELSMQSVNNSIDQFLSSLFVTVQLLPETDFHERLDLLIEQSKLNAPTIFDNLLFLIRSVNHGNAVISTYGTNFEYVVPWSEVLHDTYASTQAMIYNDECSCGLYMNCLSQASFINQNSSEIIPIKGLRIGCTPSESFHASTLECFYDPSCINLIQDNTNYIKSINFTSSLNPLSIMKSQYSINATIAELIDNLFIEQWIATINYSSYFERCSPLLYSYTCIEQFNLLYTVTVLLGLQGGPTIVLK
ncbi:unnamed protein product [Rotaria sp. Silwood2]|nr:unnamed protein product [Rotaria sp. Silwood2]CAF4295921.1 unnamed protein product [Rotaria sp. Silwood2]CAF4551277.1 unnamed protein product [Rotaria sp. Silwood2]